MAEPTSAADVFVGEYSKQLIENGYGAAEKWLSGNSAEDQAMLDPDKKEGVLIGVYLDIKNTDGEAAAKGWLASLPKGVRESIEPDLHIFRLVGRARANVARQDEES